MNKNSDTTRIVKSKSNFIYENSGLILSKLSNEFTELDTSNCLELLLISDMSLEELNSVRLDLLQNNCDITFTNSYLSALEIIFYVAVSIDKMDKQKFSDEYKLELRNKLRLYPIYFSRTKDDLLINNNKSNSTHKTYKK